MTDKQVNNLSQTIDIGQTLQNAREKQDISLATAAMQTNLSHAILTKLEDNQFNDIGAPVFTRGYLNIYARFLGLDAEELSNAFNHINYEDHTDIRLTPANVASQQKSFKRNHLLKWLLLVPLFLLTAFILMQVMSQDSWLMQQVKNAFPDQDSSQTESTGAAGNEIVLEIDAPTLNEGTQVVPAEQNIPALTSLDSLEDASDSEGAPQNDSLIQQTSQEVNQEMSLQPQQVVTADDTSMDEEATGASTAEQPASNSSGLLTITNENWVEVKDKDGTTIASRIFYQNETIALPASGSPYSLNIGRPNSIVLSINGQQKALSTYQRSGSTRLFEVDIQ